MLIEAVATLMLLGASPPPPDDADGEARPILTLDDVTYELKLPHRTLYPYTALMRGIEGEATLVCYIHGSGAVGDCTIVEETPDGAQFGVATSREFANFLRVGPRTKSGEPTAGRRIRLSQTWRIPTGKAGKDFGGGSVKY